MSGEALAHDFKGPFFSTGHALGTASMSATDIAIAAARLDDALHLVHQATWALRLAPHSAPDLCQRAHVVCAELAELRDAARHAVPGSAIGI